jgi:hypothetical protein
VRNWTSAILGTALLAAVCAVAAGVPTAFGHGVAATEEAPHDIALYPLAHASHVGQPFKLTAFIVEREPNEPIEGQQVTALVISGPSAGRTMSDVTDQNGAAHFTYTSGATGTDEIQASFFDQTDGDRACSNVIAQTWVPLGTPLPNPPPGPSSAPPPPTTTPPPTTGGPVAGGQPPGCRAPALVKTPGATDFAPVQPGQTLPVGTIVDASGESSLTIQKPTGQAMVFYGVPDNVPTQFVIASAANGGAGLIGIKLTGGNFGVCTTSSSSRYLAVAGSGSKKKPKKKTKPVRRLWGSGKGSYQTTGKFASAEVRGTNWLVADYCNGTLITVRNGVVIVTDLLKHRKVIIRSGKSYFAGRPG